MKVSRTLVALVAIVAVAAIVPVASAAVSRGEAEAVLEAFTTGGRTIVFHASERSNGAPGDFLGSHGAIRPFAGSPWDGAHYCKDDWHAILLAVFDGNEIGGPQAKVPAIRARLAGVAMAFTLNGVPLETARGAVKSFHEAANFGLQDAFGFQQGTVVKLGPGTYQLAVSVTDPIYGDFEDGITFFVDAASCG